jgi:hypothetical protein
VWLAQDESTLDLFGRGLVLLRFGEPAGEALTHAASRRSVPLRMVKIENEEARRMYERRLVLVRPDGHVAWRADSDPSDAEALRIIDTIRGAG